jgi:hypothetical protein
MAIAYVNRTATVHGGGGTQESSAVFSATTGNLLVVFTFVYPNTIAVSSVTDTAGNTYQSTGLYQADGGCRFEVWYAQNIAGNASNQVTVHWASATTGAGLIVAQYSGVATAGAYDTGSKQMAYGTTSLTTAAFNPTVADGLIIAWCWQESGGDVNWTAGAGYTSRATNPDEAFFQDKLAGTTGSQTTSFTWDLVSSGMANIVSCFKPAAAAPSPYAGPAMDASWPVYAARVNGTGSSLAVATPVTAGTDRLIYATLTWNTRSPFPTIAPTVSGLGLTWTKIISNSSGVLGAELWAAWASGSLGTGTVTANFGSSVTLDALLTVYARSGTASGAAGVANCFGVINKRTSNTGSTTAESVNLSVQASSGAVYMINDGQDGVGISPLANTVIDAQSHSVVSQASGSLTT